METDTFEKRAEAVLATTYRGLHHVGKIKKLRADYWEVNMPAQVATYDFDELTRLVVMAHDQCVRVEIGSSGPRMIKIILSPRTREGNTFAKHPTIEDAIKNIRNNVYQG